MTTPTPGPSGSSRDLSGRQLGDYRLLRRLGRGAMAEVYLAEQVSLQRQVALKVLKQDLADDQTYVARFQREARAAASLTHANIVQIHEVGCVEDVYYIAQEFVDGPNLQQWLARNGAPDLKTAMVVMWQVASALAKAAEQGIVHRDIKPENILLAKSGEVKVADFGLARVAEPRDGLNLTQIGITLGTPLYMSPEQVEGGKLDPRSDIYSFGVTCYHMLSGEPPFTGDTALSVAVQHLKRDPKPLESLRPDLPPAFARLVHTMLAKQPDQRYASPREVQRQLREIQLKHLGDDWPEQMADWNIAAVDVAATTALAATQRLDAAMKTETRKTRRQSRRRLLHLAAGGFAMLLLGGAAAYIAVVREPPLLAEMEGPGDRIAPRATVSEQWLYAAETGTPEAWQSVIDNFPEDRYRYWRRHAKRQLVRRYLHEEDFAQARPWLLEFYGARDAAEQAFGMAGLFWIAVREGDLDAAAVYQMDESLESELENDPYMRDLYRAAKQRVASRSNRPAPDASG